MSNNNVLTFNDAIVNLQTMDTFHNDLISLREFLKEADLNGDDKQKLQDIINLANLKHIKIKETVFKTMNGLHRMDYY